MAIQAIFAAMIVVVAQCGAFAFGSVKFKTLHQFGHYKSGVIQGSDGDFYGATGYGGTNGEGSFYQMTPCGVLTTLYSFSGHDGSYPFSGVVQAGDGNFYGTTTEGGASDDGTVYRITPSGTLTTLHSFSGADGATPYGTLCLATDGKLYGTTGFGGLYGSGTIFAISLTGSFFPLHSFDQTDGECPFAKLTQGTDGNFYGTTLYGGSGLGGTVFQTTPSGTLTSIHSFNQSDGSPYGGLGEGTDGNYYGATSGRQDANSSLIYQVTSGGIFTVYDQTSYFGTPIYCYTSLLAGSNGLLYGIEANIHAQDESQALFSISPSSNQPQLSNGYNPSLQYHIYGDLVQGADGNIYGVTTQGGALDDGGLLNLTASSAPTLLSSFTGQEGDNPTGSLIEGLDGDLYGTTTGNEADFGTVFKLTVGDAFIPLHNFDGSDGFSPEGSLLQTSDGSFYGTTFEGGAAGPGTTFTMTESGLLSTLTSFTGINGANPVAGLTLGVDGDLYGCTGTGGTGSVASGTLFKLDLTGSLTNVYDFSFDGVGAAGNTLIGAAPAAKLVAGSDGTLYGTTELEGPNSDGCVFSLSPTGVVAVVHAFNGTDGATPLGITIDTNGNFCGIAQFGGSANDGTVYRLAPDDVMLWQHSFLGADGEFPMGTPIEASDGNFYGTTWAGGYYGYGTIYKSTPSGLFSTVYNFDGIHGNATVAGLLQGSDGKFYGCTSEGGSQAVLGNGTVFSLDLGLPPLGTPPPAYAAGLNFFSSPFDYTGASLDTLLGYSGVKLAVWSAATGGYSITPTAPADAIHPGVGYWARFPSTETFANVGPLADETVPFTINLAQGWNMIGDPFLLAVPLSATTYGTSAVSYAAASTGGNPLIRAGVYGYSSSSNEYVAGSTLQPFAGYWIYANSATTMNVPYP